MIAFLVVIDLSLRNALEDTRQFRVYVVIICSCYMNNGPVHGRSLPEIGSAFAQGYIEHVLLKPAQR